MPHRSVRPEGITSTLEAVDDSDWRSAVATDVVDVFSELMKSCEMFCSIECFLVESLDCLDRESRYTLLILA